MAEARDKKFATGGRFIEYRHVPEWAAGVHDLLDDIEEPLSVGHAEAVVTLTEDAPAGPRPRSATSTTQVVG